MAKIDSKKIIRSLTPVLPYVLISLAATNLGEAWRLADGANASEKIIGLLSAILIAFGNFWPSLHPFDLLIGAVFGVCIRIAVFLKGKNAKNYRHNVEYGSARWGTKKDIEPFVDPEFQDRSTLWNRVEQIEKAKDSQLAREVEVALPIELSREQQLALVRSFVKDNFVSVGMCADFAIHDRGTGKPPRPHYADCPPSERKRCMGSKVPQGL